MNATELFTAGQKPAAVWFCSRCKRVAGSQHLAEQCCQNYKCSTCGLDTGSRSWLICDACRGKQRLEQERERFEKAEKLTEWDGWVFCEGLGREGFASDIVELLDGVEEGEEPEYVWTCAANNFVSVDVSSILERICEQGYEDFSRDDLNGVEELQKALSDFQEANKDIAAYKPDYSKALLVKGYLETVQS